MWRVVTTLWTVLRELALALMAQPSRPGATRPERDSKAAQAERLREAPDARLLDAARQVGAEVGKTALGQPTPAARRRKEKP
ncbi:hypothetical protein [Deinococcus sp. Leaf326]|jgi:hypothetical protein|uniref:hypothetical protein n=1 Tax=Deinococcus sp. Leaf326 TaxID=1736338 RepID=UPI00071442E7|nr:hypothetical protein [Deinococcus sp. Leaf326]KQR15543.1 hypothetical protein ASF71_07800 [Deinococcus sp. Leaf326]